MSDESEEGTSDSKPEAPKGLSVFFVWVKDMEKPWKALVFIFGIGAVGFSAATVYSSIATTAEVKEVQTAVEEVIETSLEETEEAIEEIEEENVDLRHDLDVHVALAEHRLADTVKRVEAQGPQLQSLSNRLEYLQLLIEQRQSPTLSARTKLHMRAERIRAQLTDPAVGEPKDAGPE